MSIDLNFLKYQNDTYLDNAAVYQKACCDNEKVEGLGFLPIEDILKETAAAFHDWDAPDRYNFGKKEGQGSFQISVSPRMVCFDCYSMEQADMKRLSKEFNGIKYNAVIHRAKTLTKVTSFLQFGSGWTNRPCQCKTAQLKAQDMAHQLLEELLVKSMERVVNDFKERTYYG